MINNGEKDHVMIYRKFPYFILACFVLQSPVEAQTHPDLGALADFPKQDRVWLGAAIGEIAINPFVKIEVKTLGTLDWRVKTGEIVKEDQIICLTDSKKIELSARELDLKKNKYQNSLKDIQAAIQDKKKALQTSIAEIEVQIAGMTLTETENKLLGSNFAKRLNAERAGIQQELEISRNKLDSDYFDVAIQNETRALDLEIEKAEYEHEQLQRNSEIRAPASGRISIETNEILKPDSLAARIIKDGTAEARLELTDPRLRNAIAEELAIQITGEDGRAYQGTYFETLSEQSMARNARIIIFSINPPASDQAIPESLNGTRMLQIQKALPKPGRIVPKADLIFKFPEEINKNGWAQFIEKRWVGSKVTYVGPRDLVILKPDED